ncbi:MAG: hypothetical protein LC798_05475 [Chloroflexi bacterium]|nr:hypothetical protein [Chloroflexota bacterium]
MPWRGPEEPGEYPTLGYLVAEWIEASCVIPDREVRGKPFLLTDEMYLFLLWMYRLVPGAREDEPASAFHFDRGAQLVRPQKWGKGPLAAAITCAEAAGPVRFAGWDADGEPVGRPWATPLIQITACSEGQTDNVWRALVPMIEQGPIAAEIFDTGETRINLPGGGRIEPVTASATSRLGNPITFAVQDQTESWLERNKGRKLADTQRRGLAGMGGRFLETANAWDPSEHSVAQHTGDEPGVHVDAVDCGRGSIHNVRERRRCLQRAYGDSWRRRKPEAGRRVNGWINLDRIDSEIEALLTRDPAQAERFYLSRVVPSKGAWIKPDPWAAKAAPRKDVAPGTAVTLGFVGLLRAGAALIGCTVSAGHLFVVGAWEGDDQHPVNRTDVGLTLGDAMETYEVSRCYVDPSQWQSELEAWIVAWGKTVVIEWWTHRPTPMAHAVERLQAAVESDSGEVSHDGNAVLARHIGNARTQKTRAGVLIVEQSAAADHQIPAAKAAVLAYEARGDVLALPPPEEEDEGEFATF